MARSLAFLSQDEEKAGNLSEPKRSEEDKKMSPTYPILTSGFGGFRHRVGRGVIRRGVRGVHGHRGGRVPCGRRR